MNSTAKLAAIALLLSFACATGASADHLVPWSLDSETQTAMQTALRAAFSNDVTARMIADPAFHKKFAVGTKKRGGKYRIFFFEERKNSPSIFQAIKGKKIAPCEQAIPASLGKRIDAVWDLMLRDAQPDKTETESEQIVLDGESYEFSKIVDGKPMAGMTMALQENSNTGKLVDVAYGMLGVCLSNDTENRAKLNDAIATLAAAMNRSIEVSRNPRNSQR